MYKLQKVYRNASTVMDIYLTWHVEQFSLRFRAQLLVCVRVQDGVNEKLVVPVVFKQVLVEGVSVKIRFVFRQNRTGAQFAGGICSIGIARVDVDFVVAGGGDALETEFEKTSFS